ncbi:MAG TPA: hypothetical protein VMV69_24570 [Pirellulales bacterium]|nr:hypothetical protein [Pirellulales bacterium]
MVIGDVILDRYVWGDAARVSPEAPVVVLRADHDEVRLGGAASVAYLLRAYGGLVRVVGAVSGVSTTDLFRQAAEIHLTDLA